MQVRHWHGRKTVENIAFEHAVPVCEEEELIFLDGPAEVAAIVVEDLFRLILAAIVPRLAALEMLVEMIAEKSAVPLVRARFGDDVHGRGSSHAFLGLVAVGGNFDLLNALDRRDVQRPATRFPEEDALRAIDARGIGR